MWPGFALLAIPGALSLLLLAQLRRRVPSVAEPDPEDTAASSPTSPGSASGNRHAVGLGTDLPGAFHLFSLAAALATAGLMTFGIISFRFVDAGLLSLAAAPVVYALAMAVEAVAALVTGDLFDRVGARVLLAVPVLVTAVPLCVFADRLWLVLVGVVVWGVATGIQDSTVKAFVADLVPARRRATAYGVFAAVQGLGALAGGALAGALVNDHVGLLAMTVAALQVASFALLWYALRARTD
jgi:MFS family permease